MSTLRRPLLIVEDEEGIVRSRMRILEKLDPERPVHTAADVAEALDLLRKGIPFAGAVLDYRLPGGTGLEVLEEIRRRDEFLPVLVLTAFKEDEVIRGSQRLGATYLVKPAMTENFQTFLASVEAYEEQMSRVGRALADLLAGAKLTGRQVEVLKTALTAPTREQAGKLLGIKLATLRSHISAICKRLGVPNLAAVRRLLLRQGLSGT